MKISWPLFTAVLVCSVSVFDARAGTLTYVAIPAAQSDNNIGITRDHGYTTAIDGGNTRGTDRILNGITLYSLGGSGQTSATADNCTVNALSGTLTDAGLTSKTIAADGVTRELMSDMVFNNSGGDNSQVEIVLDPESLEEGATYDLRVYVTSSSGQNRQVNLAFFGDGQDGVQTGFFNEDDARTSPGRFQTAGQTYYINYRYTWDGDSTPGITITQKFGGAPFCLYALTNELVAEGDASAAAASSDLVLPDDNAEAGADAAAETGAEAAGSEGEEGLTAGFVEQESDQIGVESDDFYQSESLNSNGRWVKLSKWGTCWQPTNVAVGWTPYTNGSWKECEDCGWTFVSDEPWAWACYHYGRWAKVGIGCGWAWVPGTVWAPSWVSWRQGRDESCNCIGWAPLPPEAGCRINVGISSWVDSYCNIGPDYYTFINIRDFGSDSYWGCGCIYDRGRNTTIIIDTFNITNICYNRNVNIYCGGPDYNWCNTRIRQLGGKECGRIYVNRYDNAGRLGGKWARREGEQLGLVAPRIRGTKNPKFRPKIAESAGAGQIDHGWKGIKDRKQEQQVRNHIAQESKGKNPRNSPAKLPPDAAEKMAKHGGGRHGKIIGSQGAGQAAQGGQSAGGGRLRPGGKGGKRGQADNLQPQGQGVQGAGTQAQTGAAGDQHPGKGRGRGQGRMGGGAAAAAGGAAAAAGAGTAGSGQATGGAGFNQHPGKGRGRVQGQKREAGQMGAAGTAGQAGANTPTGAGQAAAAGGGRRRPGQSLGKKRAGGAAGTGAATAGGTTGAAQTAGGGAPTQTGGQHPGRRKGRGQGQPAAQGGQLGAGQGVDTSAGQAQGAGAGKKGRRNRGQGAGQGQGGAFEGSQTQSSAGQRNAGAGQAQTGGGTARGKGKRRQQQQQTAPGGQSQTQGQGQVGGGQAQGQTGGGRQGRRRQQQQMQPQQQPRQGTQAQGQGQASGGQVQGQGGQRRGGGGGGARRQQQLQQQQQAQQQRQLQQQQAQQQRQLQQQQAQQQRQLQQQQVQQPRQQQQQQIQQGGGGGGGRGGRGGGGGGKRRGPTPTPPPG